MATLSKARDLLSDLRSASFKAALKDHEELKAFVQEQVAAEKGCKHQCTRKYVGSLLSLLIFQAGCLSPPEISCGVKHVISKRDKRTVRRALSYDAFGEKACSMMLSMGTKLTVACQSLCYLFMQGFKEELQQWDLTFWSEQLREAKFNISDEQLRPYFSLPNVLDGLFKVILTHLHILSSSITIASCCSFSCSIRQNTHSIQHIHRDKVEHWT